MPLAPTNIVWQPPPPPPLAERAVHVWRIRLGEGDVSDFVADLSADECERAERFHFPSHRRDYIIAHSMLRRILGLYAQGESLANEFHIGPYGKPSLPRRGRATPIEFSLAHSGELALVAVSRGSQVGIDVERWSDRIQHLELAERFFSPQECASLRTQEPQLLTQAFFAAWSRKEAYIKATGYGVSRGLGHFDVALDPNAPAQLLADRLDASACGRWSMTSLDVGPGYSAALVAEQPVESVQFFG